MHADCEQGAAGGSLLQEECGQDGASALGNHACLQPISILHACVKAAGGTGAATHRGLAAEALACAPAELLQDFEAGIVGAAAAACAQHPRPCDASSMVSIQLHTQALSASLS